MNKTIDSYVAAVRTLEMTCKFEGQEEEIIRDRIVLEITDNHTLKKLLQEKGLDLQRCADICRVDEKFSSQLRAIEEVQFVRETNNPKPVFEKTEKSQRQ